MEHGCHFVKGAIHQRKQCARLPRRENNEETLAHGRKAEREADRERQKELKTFQKGKWHAEGAERRERRRRSGGGSRDVV